MGGRLCVIWLCRCSGFTQLQRFFRLHLQLRDPVPQPSRGPTGGGAAVSPAPRGTVREAGRALPPSFCCFGVTLLLALSFPLLLAVNLSEHLLQESFERSPLLCLEGIYSQKAPSFGVQRLPWRGGTHFLLIFLCSSVLHAHMEVTFYCQF